MGQGFSNKVQDAQDTHPDLWAERFLCEIVGQSMLSPQALSLSSQGYRNVLGPIFTHCDLWLTSNTAVPMVIIVTTPGPENLKFQSKLCKSSVKIFLCGLGQGQGEEKFCLGSDGAALAVCHGGERAMVVSSPNGQIQTFQALLLSSEMPEACLPTLEFSFSSPVMVEECSFGFLSSVHWI